MPNPLRFLLGAILSCAFVSQAFAQAPQPGENQPPIRFSVAAGFNISSLTFPLPSIEEIPLEGLAIENNSRIGVVAGGLVDFRVAPNIGVLTGALMSTRGGTLEIQLPAIPVLPPPGFDLSGPIKADLRMIYVDVPMLLAAGVAHWGDQKIEAIGGGMLGLKASARTKVTFAGISQEEPFDENLPAFDFGLSAGARYSCGHIFAAAYYTWGLTDLTEGDGAESIKHRYLTVIGGWRF